MEQSETNVSCEAPEDHREADAPAGTAEPSSGDNDAPGRQDELSLYNIIRKHAADTPFASCLENRRTTATTICDGERGTRYYLGAESPESILREVEASNASDATVLILEDIDQAWCSALCDRYPDSLCWMFLARHIVRAGDPGRSYSDEDAREYFDMIQRVAENLSAKRQSMDFRVDKDFKIHIDYMLDVLSHESRRKRSTWITADDQFRRESFLIAYGKFSTRISCSHLTDFLCMQWHH